MLSNLSENMTSATPGNVDNKHTTDYRYDANGERICKYSDLGETIYASGYYTETDGKKISKHIYIGSTRVASQVMSRSSETSTTMKRENTLYYHTDHLGSSGYVTDKKGEFYEHTEYTSSGESWVNEKVTGNADLPFKYTSKEQDAETGLYYHSARYRDARTGVWLSCDPYLTSGDYFPVPPVNDKAKERNKNLPGMGGIFNSVNMNAYHYAGNNPIKYIDPDGKADIMIIKTKTGVVLDSEALLYKNGTFQGKKFEAFKSWVKLKEQLGFSVTKEDAIMFFGQPDKVFNNFKTVSDNTSIYGVAAAKKVYNYKRGDWAPSGGVSAYLLTDPSVGYGKVPQDPRYGNPKGSNPGDGGSHPSYLEGSFLHRAYAGGSGSHGCIIQMGFDNPGGLGHYFESNPQEQTGKVLIYR